MADYRKAVETGVEVEQQQPPRVNKDGTLNLGGNEVEVVPGAPKKEFLEMLKFMEEPVTIRLHETTDQNAENPVTVGCNGFYATFWRGKETTVARKYVDCLIVKEDKVSTPKQYSPQTGEMMYSIHRVAALKYPFAVVKDDNPKGAQWLRQRCAQAV